MRAFAHVVSAMAAASVLAGCQGTGPQNEAAAPPAAQNPLVAQARDFLKRAETAPLPTPLPPPSPIPRGWKPLPPPELAGKVDDLDTMDWGHQEDIRRAREKDTVTPRVR